MNEKRKVIEYSVGQLAKFAGVSVKTLHHYHRLKLLVPAKTADSGYRFYSEADAKRLFDILFYRALGFSLTRIADVIVKAPTQKITLLTEQKVLLDEHISRLTRMREQLVKAVQKEENHMSINEKFGALDGFDPDQFETEAEQKWGETDAWKTSAQRTKNYTQADWRKYKLEANDLNAQLATAMEDGVPADSKHATAIAEKMRLQIDHWFYPCSRQMHEQLGLMYVQDERFTKTYEDIKTGMAGFLQKAISANFSINGESERH